MDETLAAPYVAPELITYLRKVFPAILLSSPSVDPDVVFAAAHKMWGMQSLIDHLDAVSKAQAEKGPL